MPMSDAAAAALVRGVAAYMQVARPTDLPVALRPLRGKHVKMLNARRRDIVAALDDEGLRALILDWLKDEPSGISKADAAILMTATQRDDGWKQALEDPGTRSKREATEKDPDEALQREKERTRKAKDEARRVKAAAARDLARERKESAAFRSEVDALKERIEHLEKELVAALKELDSARSEADREVRKARKRAEKAEGALEEHKTRTRALRAELAAAKAGAMSDRKKTPRRRTAPGASVGSGPERRRRLPVPKGRFEDDPETLTEWLSTPSVHLLVDGYNVSKAEGGFGDLTLENQRDRLLQEIGKIVRGHKIRATVIFDGSEVAPGTSRRARGPVEVEYSRAEEIADDHLIAKLEALPKHPVVVVTNDRELQNRAARLGATIATSNQLLRLIR